MKHEQCEWKPKVKDLQTISPWKLSMFCLPLIATITMRKQIQYLKNRHGFLLQTKIICEFGNENGL